MNHVIIMAGGAGTRFWPLSTEDKPKQFLDILGSGRTFLQMTYDRYIGLIPLENIHIVTNDKYKSIIQEQLPALPESQIICEPSRNNTAPCILLAALKIYNKDRDASCFFVPSDHLILNLAVFQKAALDAWEYAARHHSIVTLGILPSRPETGYGYIHYDKKEVNEIKQVLNFVEKPNQETAAKYLMSGDYLWNAGMFAWHVNTIIEEYKTFAPQIYQILYQGMDLYNTVDESQFLKQNYPQTENISVDFAIIEKSKKMFTIPVDFGWSDLGIWSSVYDISDKTTEDNVIISGSVYLENVKNSLISIEGKKKVIIGGLTDYLVIDTDDALLIFPKAEEMAIKAAVKRI